MDEDVEIYAYSGAYGVSYLWFALLNQDKSAVLTATRKINKEYFELITQQGVSADLLRRSVDHFWFAVRHQPNIDSYLSTVKENLISRGYAPYGKVSLNIFELNSETTLPSRLDLNGVNWEDLTGYDRLKIKPAPNLVPALTLNIHQSPELWA